MTLEVSSHARLRFEERFSIQNVSLIKSLSEKLLEKYDLLDSMYDEKGYVIEKRVIIYKDKPLIGVIKIISKNKIVLVTIMHSHETFNF